MKKEIKLYISILMMIVAVFILPTATIFAVGSFNGYVSSEENFESEYLNFINVKFVDNSNNSTMSFGLVGEVENTLTHDVKCKIKINYYDKKYNLVATSTKDMRFSAETSTTFTHMSTTSIIKDGYNVSDIYRYTIYVEENRVSKENDADVTINYEHYDYVLDSYDVEIVVNENNTFDITEKITAYFIEEKHGIFRKLPLKNTITRLDGTKSTNNAKITNVSVLNNEFDTYKENGNYVIKIGSASKTLTGKKEYTIKYHYNIGKDKSKDYDELYYNIIGTEWDTAIDNVTFTIKMPKEFDASKLGFSAGSYGSTNSDNIIYNVDGNIITGSYESVLDEGEGLTIRLELPEGYFEGAESTVDKLNYILYSLPIIFVLVSLFLWKKYGKDDEVIETVEFYPPEGYNSLEVGFLYKGKAENEDVVSLLVYLANKGYVKITETENTSFIFKTKSVVITKLKEYDGNNPTEKLFLNGLFKYGRTEVELEDLNDSFYITMNKILSKINTKNNKHQIFEKSSLKKNGILVLMIIATFILITVKPMLEYGGAANLIVGLLFPGIGFTVLFAMVFGKTPIPTKIFGVIWGMGFGGMPWTMLVLPVLLVEPIYLVGYIIGLACIAAMIMIIRIMPKRTDYGTEILGKIKGFKTFLETVEKERLEALVMENPTYFYDILPYAYVLGVSDKWISKFEIIAMEKPDWYSGTSEFSAATFERFMSSTMSSVKTAMSSSPSSSSGGSGGGSSGGGSSGGGSGGGGGGSW